MQACRRERKSCTSESTVYLQLMGVLIAVRLAETLVAEIMTKIEKIIFCCDSTTVLHWIPQTSSNYKTFVGNRVSEIHTTMSDLEATLGADMMSWRYVPTENNLANDITGGLGPTALNIGHRYNDGPGFLYESAEL